MRKMKFFYLAIFLLCILLPNRVFSFSAGIYSQILKIPVGVPTAGYAQSLPSDEPKSPFAAKFPATRGIHTFIKVKVIYLQDENKNSLSIIRLDTVGVDVNIYKMLQEKIENTLKEDFLKHTLILSATHTHAGPGRLAQNPLWHLACDTYSPYLFESVLQQIFNAWDRARINLQPAKIGFGSVNLGEIISDRRCENPPLKDEICRFIKIENKKGKILAIILNFGIHGTVLSASNHYFSQDAPGLIEMKLEEKFEYPLQVFFIQGCAGDIAPHSPVDFQNPWDNMENIGEIAARKILPELLNTKTTEKLFIKSISLNIPLSREILGYKEGEFPYPYGAGLCGLGAERCDSDYSTPVKEMENCPIYGEKFAMLETILTCVKLNEFLILTLPGEPLVSLGEELRRKIKEETGEENLLIFGYSQDHLGYLLLSWDWWQGGYEPSMTLWGWKLGEFLIEKCVQMSRNILKNEPLPEIASFEKKAYKRKTVTPPPPETAIDVGRISADITVSEGEIKFSWFGGDPSVDIPSVVVEQKKKNKWIPVLQKNGLPLTAEHYSIFLNFSPIPNYKDSPKEGTRKFRWEISWRYKRKVPSTLIIKSGIYRFRIKGQAFYNGKIQKYQLVSSQIKL